MPTPDPFSRTPGRGREAVRPEETRPDAAGKASLIEEERRRLKRRLELQQLVHEFSSKMRSQRNVEDIAKVLTEAVSELTSFRNAMFTVLDDDGITLRGVWGSGHRRTYEIGSRLSKYSVNRIKCDVRKIPAYYTALETGQIMYHRTKEDIVSTLSVLTGLNPGILEIIRRTTRLNLGVTVPLFVGDPETRVLPMGIMAISSIKTELDEEDVRVVRILANQASLALHNLRLIKKLEQRAKEARHYGTRFRNMMDSAHDMIASHGPEGSPNYVNKAFRDSGVYSTDEELISESTISRVHPDDQAKLVEAYLGLKEAVPIHGIEYRIRVNGPEYLYHNLNAVTIINEEGAVQETTVFIRDVTQDRLREKQLLRRNKELEILNALITNLTSPLGYGEMIERSLNIIGEFSNADIIIFLSEDVEDHTRYRVQHQLWVPEQVERMHPGVFPKEELDPHLSENEVRYVDDIKQLPPEYYALSLKLGLEFVMSIPVNAQGEVVGYIIAGAKEKMVLDDEDIAILRAVGDQLGMVLETARLRREVAGGSGERKGGASD